ncbi:XRE family transcriptional regulator [Pseudomonas putida]|uniref:XRE family transcriptional regulator n=1 Tax=Pseudomonas putida TaxID=303 RepID=UPI00370A0A26
MTDLKIIVAQRLKQCRHDREWTMKTVVQELRQWSGVEVGESAYSNWENGLRMPPPEMLIKLGDLFGVAPAWLQGFTSHSSTYMNSYDYITANSPNIVTKNGDLTLKQASAATAYNLEYLKSRRLDRNRVLSIKQLDSSMAGLIDEGDEILIDQTRCDVDGRDLYAIVAPSNAIWIRWISRELDGNYRLSAQNTEHADVIMDPDAFDKITVVGRVARIAHDR